MTRICLKKWNTLVSYAVVYLKYNHSVLYFKAKRSNSPERKVKRRLTPEKIKSHHFSLIQLPVPQSYFSFPTQCCVIMDNSVISLLWREVISLSLKSATTEDFITMVLHIFIKSSVISVQMDFA